MDAQVPTRRQKFFFVRVRLVVCFNCVFSDELRYRPKFAIYIFEMHYVNCRALFAEIVEGTQRKH